MKYFLFILFTFFVFTSCETADTPIAEIETEEEALLVEEVIPCDTTIADFPDNLDAVAIPESKRVDYDQDGEDDFLMSYELIQTLDVPTSFATINGMLEPIGSYQFLNKREGGYLFLSEGDTIRKAGGAGTKWYGFYASLISRNWNRGVWDKEWTIQSDQISAYILGLKETRDNGERIGWLLLEFDTSSGEIKIKAVTLKEEDVVKIE